MPQNIDNQGREIKLPLDPNYVGQLIACETTEEPIKVLPIAPTAPSVATDPDLHGPRPATAKNIDNQNSHRVSHEDELRLRHAERQKRYREHKRNVEADVQKQLTVTASEIESTRVERHSLLTQHIVLSKAVDYCTTTFQAAQTLVTESFNRAHSQCQTALEGMAWLGLQVYSPNDAQLHAFIDRKGVDELDDMSAKVMRRSFDLFMRDDTEPEARENIDAQLARIQHIRFRCLKHLYNTRPDVAAEIARRRIMPTGPDGAPNPKLEAAVAAMELTQGQLDSFKQQWILYLQKAESMRQEVRSLISFLSSSSADDTIASFSSMQAAGLFTNRLQAVQELQLHPSEEAQAILHLFFWLPVNLTVHQKSILMRHSMPFYPDIIQMGRILCGDVYGSGIESEQEESVYPEFETSYN